MSQMGQEQGYDVEVGPGETVGGEPVIVLLWHKFTLDESQGGDLKPVTAIAVTGAFPLCQAILNTAEGLVAKQTGQTPRSQEEIWWERIHKGLEILRDQGYELPEDAEDILVNSVFS